MNKGVVALVTVLLLGAVLTEIALAGMFVVYVLNTSSFGLRSSSVALAAAQSGVDDALLQLVRNKDYVGSYSLLPSLDTTVDVVNAGLPCGSVLPILPKSVTITSKGIAGLQRRKLQADVVVDCATGEVRVVSIKEISAI